MTNVKGWRYPLAIDEAVRVLVAAGVVVRDPRQLVRDMLNAYELTARDQEAARVGHYVHETTRALAGLDVGKGILLVGTSQDAVRMKWKAARKLMNNPDAAWRSETRKDGLWVERIADGTRYVRPPTAAPIVRELLTVRPGQTIVSKTIRQVRGAGQLNTWHKARARQHLEDPAADWSVRQHGDKVRLTRTR